MLSKEIDLRTGRFILEVQVGLVIADSQRTRSKVLAFHHKALLSALTPSNAGLSMYHPSMEDKLRCSVHSRIIALRSGQIVYGSYLRCRLRRSSVGNVVGV